MASLKHLFMLEPGVIFLNHGSFGACPRSVFKTYQSWQRELEKQPVRFLNKYQSDFEKEARGALGVHINADPNDLTFVTNATYGVNIVSRALALNPGDEILTTHHEYGACNNAWKFACRKTGAAYIQHPISLPVKSMEQVADEIWRGVNPRTKVIYLSHITSPTALKFPIEEICRRARQAGILTVIDGAHAPGQIPLDMAAIGADFYTGNCHKWMLSPKGSGFLYARREVQHLVEPLVVSRAFEPELSPPILHPMVDYFVWNGTRDPAAYLTVPAAIKFMQENHWDDVRQRCHWLLRRTIERICDLSGEEPIYPLDSDFYYQMGIAPLSPVKDVSEFARRVSEDYNIVVPIGQWIDGRLFTRISVQGYTTQRDLDTYLRALKKLLRECAK
jgi:isopenicillin-N epimerase